MGWSSIRSWWPLLKRGSEGGGIVIDEEHSEGARITLERKTRSAPFAITCGIYGWMVHTRFFGEERRAREEVEDMKRDIELILARLPLVDDPEVDARMNDVIDAIHAFVEKYPT